MWESAIYLATSCVVVFSPIVFLTLTQILGFVFNNESHEVLEERELTEQALDELDTHCEQVGHGMRIISISEKIQKR